jgi:hypothetical protein
MAGFHRTMAASGHFLATQPLFHPVKQALFSTAQAGTVFAVHNLQH